MIIGENSQGISFGKIGLRTEEVPSPANRSTRALKLQGPKKKHIHQAPPKLALHYVHPKS